MDHEMWNHGRLSEQNYVDTMQNRTGMENVLTDMFLIKIHEHE